MFYLFLQFLYFLQLHHLYLALLASFVLVAGRVCAASFKCFEWALLAQSLLLRRGLGFEHLVNLLANFLVHGSFEIYWFLLRSGEVGGQAFAGWGLVRQCGGFIH